MSVPGALTDTGEKVALGVTLTVRTRVIKLPAIANAWPVISSPTKTKVTAHYVPKTVRIKHAIPIPECVIKVVLMDTGATIVISHVARNATDPAHKILDSVTSAQQKIYMDFYAIYNVVLLVC